MDSRKKKLTQYVVPTILGNCAYFLFTIIDGIFVGQGVGTDALGAVNLVWPFVMVLNAIIMLTVVGGVTVSAVRIGRGDITTWRAGHSRRRTWLPACARPTFPRSSRQSGCGRFPC